METMKNIRSDETLRAIRELLDDAVNDIFLRFQESEGIKSGDISPMDSFELDSSIDLLAQHIHGVLAIQKRNQLRKESASEIFYTGGGIWCGVVRLPDGNWFSGELNSWGDVYKTEDEAIEFMGEASPDFVRHETDFCKTMEIWKTAIEAERSDMHNLACYVDEWMAEWKKTMEAGEEAF